MPRNSRKPKYDFRMLPEGANVSVHFAKGPTALGQVPVITIIDDDASVRVATNRLVRSLGYVTHAFASADEFLRSPQVNATSCVIADVHMPGMDGIELQSHLRAQGSRLPIIFITAFPDERIRARALEGGAVGLLAKPFDAATLIKCLDVALGKGRGGNGN
jgi:FixJ family two-component response regulator